MRSDLLQDTISIQHQASDPRNSAWVFASAGSGKTKVLIDRLLRLLLDGVIGSKILCVTFTKVAANEMQERILKVLESWSVMSEKDLELEIETLIGSPVSSKMMNFATSLYQSSFDVKNKVKVVTIHSLCQDILRIFPFEAGVSPNFEIMDQVLEQEYLQKAKSEVFRCAFLEKELADIIAEISSDTSQEELLSLIAKFLSDKEKFFKLKDTFGNIELAFEKILASLGLNADIYDRDNFRIFLEGVNRGKITDIVDDISNSVDLKATDQNLVDFFSVFLDLEKDDFLSKSKLLFATSKGSPKKVIITKKFECYNDFVKDLQEEFLEYFDLENSIITAKKTFLVLQLVDRILQKYQEIKFSNANIDYNDLIIKVQKLLRNEGYKDWIKYRLDGFFDHVLVDESQDTNEGQWSVIEAICEEFFVTQLDDKNRSIFVIGDEKQSIFSFQGADPDISYKKFLQFQEAGRSCDKEIHNLTLNNSFRSTSNILSFVDNIFQKQNDFIKTKYNHHSAVRKVAGNVTIWPRFFDENKSDKNIKMLDFQDVFLHGTDGDESDKHKKSLAEFIANQIKKWVNDGRKIPNRGVNEEEVPIKFEDVMIVLRNQTNGLADAIKNEFLRQGIPFDGDRKISFSDNLLLLDVVSALRFAVFSADDLNLAALLKSPFFRVSESYIFEICKIKSSLDISIFEVISCRAKKYAFKNGIEFSNDYFDDSNFMDNELILSDELCFNIYSKLCNIIKNYQNLEILEFYIWLLDDSFKESCLGEFEDSDLKILDEFLIFLIQVSNKGNLNGRELLRYIDESGPSLVIKGSNRDAVKITTIHSAKGLQSPVVIIPDCCFNFNKMPSVKDNLLWLKRSDDFYGFYELPIWLARKKNSSRIVDIELKNRSDMLKSEYLRLFYVALTRAENELYIAGFGNDNDIDSWYNLAEKSINEQENE